MKISWDLPTSCENCLHRRGNTLLRSFSPHEQWRWQCPSILQQHTLSQSGWHSHKHTTILTPRVSGLNILETVMSCTQLLIINSIVSTCSCIMWVEQLMYQLSILTAGFVRACVRMNLRMYVCDGNRSRMHTLPDVPWPVTRERQIRRGETRVYEIEMMLALSSESTRRCSFFPVITGSDK